MTSRQFIYEDIIFLSKYLKDNNCQNIAFWLLKKGPEAERRYFELGTIHSIQDLFQRALNRALPVKTMHSAISEGAGNLRVANLWFDYINNPSFVPPLEMPPPLPAADFGAPPVLGHSNSSGVSASKIAQAFMKSKAKKDITCRDFFTATDGSNYISATKLIMALDETGLWQLYLADTGMTESKEVAAEVVQREKAWIEHQISPTKRMVADLMDTQWADEPMKEFAEYYKSKGNAQINEIINEWLSKIEGKIVSAQKAGITRFETAKTLNQFFMDLDDEVFSPEIIPEVVSKLQADHINSIKLLKKLKDEDFKGYGLKMGQIIVLREALDLHDKTN